MYIHHLVSHKCYNIAVWCAYKHARTQAKHTHTHDVEFLQAKLSVRVSSHLHISHVPFSPSPLLLPLPLTPHPLIPHSHSLSLILHPSLPPLTPHSLALTPHSLPLTLSLPCLHSSPPHTSPSLLTPHPHSLPSLLTPSLPPPHSSPPHSSPLNPICSPYQLSVPVFQATKAS